MALTGEERDALVAFVDRIIPADELGPGAVEAGVVTYIERALGAEYAPLADDYRRGLAHLDAAAAQAGGVPFASLSAADRDALLVALETSADAGERAFFELVRGHVIEGMFGDPSWGGNADRVGWRLIGYPGPRRVWTEHEQQLDVIPDDDPGR